MIKKLFWLALLLIPGKRAWTQQYDSNLVEFDHLILERIEVHYLNGNASLAESVLWFTSVDGQQVALQSYAINPFRNIAVLGDKQVCVCIGDTISFDLHLYHNANSNSKIDQVMRFYTKAEKFKLDKKPKMREFTLKQVERKVGIPPIDASNLVLKYQNTLYIAKVLQESKRYNAHKGGDHCSSCEKTYNGFH